jgi:hypothetical protein
MDNKHVMQFLVSSPIFRFPQWKISVEKVEQLLSFFELLLKFELLFYPIENFLQKTERPNTKILKSKKIRKPWQLFIHKENFWIEY